MLLEIGATLSLLLFSTLAARAAINRIHRRKELLEKVLLPPFFRECPFRQTSANDGEIPKNSITVDRNTLLHFGLIAIPLRLIEQLVAPFVPIPQVQSQLITLCDALFMAVR